MSRPAAHSPLWRTRPAWRPVAQVRIFSSMLPPQTAFTSVRYADHWFWIDDEDYSSKRAFTFLLLLSALVESAGDGRAPLVTIPTG